MSESNKKKEKKFATPMASLTMMALGWLKFGETQQTNQRGGDRVKVSGKKRDRMRRSREKKSAVGAKTWQQYNGLNTSSFTCAWDIRIAYLRNTSL